MKQKTLLPIGFEDMIIPEAGQAHEILCKIIDCFQGFGYGLISPPVLEFEDAHSALSDSIKVEDMFRLIDPISHRSMALRSDITFQVIRMVNDHFKQQPRPLRLCYYGQVFRIQGSNLRPNRQYMQLGLEHIGTGNQGGIEVLQIALEALKQVNISGICLDFLLPTILQPYWNSLDENARQLLSARNLGGIEKLTKESKIDKKLGDLLVFLLSLPPDFASTLHALRHKKHIAISQKLLDQLEAQATTLQHSHPEVQLSLDGIEQKHFSDKTGVGYSLYAQGLNAVLGRGGQYQAFDDNANGISLYLESIIAVAKTQKQTRKIRVPIDTDFSVIRKLRAEGWQVFMQDEDTTYPDITHYWDGEKVHTSLS